MSTGWTAKEPLDHDDSDAAALDAPENVYPENDANQEDDDHGAGCRVKIEWHVHFSAYLDYHYTAIHLL